MEQPFRYRKLERMHRLARFDGVSSLVKEQDRIETAAEQDESSNAINHRDTTQLCWLNAGPASPIPTFTNNWIAGRSPIAPRVARFKPEHLFRLACAHERLMFADFSLERDGREALSHQVAC